MSKPELHTAVAGNNLAQVTLTTSAPPSRQPSPSRSLSETCMGVLVGQWNRINKRLRVGFFLHIYRFPSVLTETPPTFAPPHRTLSITMTTFDERMLQQCRCHACGGLNNIDTPLFIRLLYLFSIIQNGAKKEKQKGKNGRSVKQIFCESNRWHDQRPLCQHCTGKLPCCPSAPRALQSQCSPITFD